jgi:preprotein translocase subunit SecG
MSGLYVFLLIIQALDALVMITVILMQRSEGGGLTGGSPSGLMTARGAADFLTRTTSICAAIFILLSIVLAALAASSNRARTIDPSLVQQAPATPQQPVNLAPNPAVPAPAANPAPATGNQSGGVPLAQ